jgi:hypothetical protein
VGCHHLVKHLLRDDKVGVALPGIHLQSLRPPGRDLWASRWGNHEGAGMQ